MELQTTILSSIPMSHAKRKKGAGNSGEAATSDCYGIRIRCRRLPLNNGSVCDWGSPGVLPTELRWLSVKMAQVPPPNAPSVTAWQVLC